jgi:hypothetical protein
MASRVTLWIRMSHHPPRVSLLKYCKQIHSAEDIKYCGVDNRRAQPFWTRRICSHKLTATAEKPLPSKRIRGLSSASGCFATLKWHFKILSLFA